ncbi:Hypothetical predicted protein [Olea europaea subsp. europaea]|uniref:DUF1985 domain-containing protein n=1 Tax=Olea europaea subsp. europaea TaxID=158383 RepID=A0A8S0STA2_OLEEU|nr:Hypothetical predicted protein [Olea europaea subsp. europaea]
MDFESLVPENARLRGYVSQRSNMRYIKIVVKHFDERQRADFRNSCLGFLSEVPDLQFSAQLIQQLVFYCIQTNKWHELWFDLQGHLARFGIQVYALVTGLRCGLLSDDNVMDRVLDKRRLKDKYFKHVDKISYAQLEQTFLRSSTPRADRYKLSLALVIERIFNAPDNNVGIDMETLSIVNDLDLFFLYPWGRISYGRLIKGFRGRWARKFLDATKKKEKAVSYTIHDFPIAIQCLGERFPWLLGWTSTKQPQQRTYDAFFKNVQLHMYATLRPTEIEDSVVLQFQAERIGTPKEGTSEDETSDEAHDGGGTSGEEEESGADESEEDEGEDSEEHDSGDSDCHRVRRSRQTGTFSTPHADYGGFAGHHPSPDGIDEDMGIDRQEGDGMCINEEHMEPCLDEQDMPLPTGTESLQDITHIQSCLVDHPVPEPSTIEEVQGIALFFMI